MATADKPKRLTQAECSLLFRLKRAPIYPTTKTDRKWLAEFERIGWVTCNEGVYSLVPDFKVGA